MTTVLQKSSRYVAQNEMILAALPGQHLAWLKAMRQNALSEFSATGFPSPREEEWKYTNVAPIERKLFAPVAAPQGDIKSALIESYRLAGMDSMVFVDGHFCPTLSSLSASSDGVIIAGMKDALNRSPDLVAAHLGRIAGHHKHGFISFNTAYFSDGAFIYLPKDTVLEKPVQLIYVSSRQDLLSTTRNLIVAEQNAQGQMIETYIGENGLGYLTASVSEVSIGENAQIDFYKLQSESEKAFHFGGVYAKQDNYGVFRHHNLSFGGLLVRNDVHSDLGNGSECYLDGLFLASNRQHVDNHTRLNHEKPHGISRETYKGILDQRARGVFQGRIVVHEGAVKTDAEMNNRNLLLSPDAEIDTKPQLEIYTDDVKCAHGVTVGQLDEESVFYLKSRCVDEDSARNMLTFAFANEMVDKIKPQCLQSLVQDEVLARFPQAGIRKDWL